VNTGTEKRQDDSMQVESIQALYAIRVLARDAVFRKMSSRS
jgi:hypothetical protein